MSILKFKCELLSDVVLNVKSASEGNKQTLDFIPGSNFLGIVAKNYVNMSSEVSWYIFHSGKVKFGDAHPIGIDKVRSVRVPASMYYPKGKEKDGIYYIHHFYDRNQDNNDNGFPYQLKQCRNGFYSFVDGKGRPSKIEKSFAIKSAYDRDKRRSKDESMFGYESLNAGMVFYFSVETENSKYDELIKKDLIGERNIGRSRTAQYGSVRISEYEYSETESRENTFKINDEDCIAVYADSRLIFMDKYGQAVYQPTPKDLGIIDENATIKWEYSQIRTFQYSPWNSCRQAYDTDRCGIEKGSVIIVSTKCKPMQSKRYIGVYNNEGFGKVIYNPEFLDADLSKNGIAAFTLQEPEKEPEKESKKKIQTKDPIDNNLITYLKSQRTKTDRQEDIYKRVNVFVADNYQHFKGDRFASQWGHIRSIAMKYRTKKEIGREIFTKEIIDSRGEHKPFAYLTHGKAAEKWNGNHRKENFEKFFNRLPQDFTDEDIRNTIVNLASQMAKKCRKENK